jgi:predicted molibdopterin-dependent oxidoreductase YjgC
MSPFRRTGPTAEAITIEVDGRAVAARPGDTVAAAMLAAGYDAIGANVKSGRPAAPWCLIGMCFGCQCSIDGAPDAQACLVLAREGMVVETPCPLTFEGGPA